MSRLESTPFGSTPSGVRATKYTLTNAHGHSLAVSDFGASLVGLTLAGGRGPVDIVLGYDSVEDYVEDVFYLGSLVGRCANRIAGARFEIDGQTFELSANHGPHQLHGGPEGFGKRMWSVEHADAAQIALRLTSPDGDQGYPGVLDVRVTYSWSDDDELGMTIEAHTDAATVCNMTQHAYWNLAGHSSGSTVAGTAEHEVAMRATHYTPSADDGIPLGTINAVASTPFDLRESRKLSLAGAQGDIDHNYVLDGESGRLRAAAEVVERRSGRRMTVATDQPGCHFYTARFLNDVQGKAGAIYGPHAGLCFETQLFPDAIHRPNWPSPVLRPGETYRHHTTWRFDAES